MFIGRKDELQLLEAKYKMAESQLVAVYGRRRIGKSQLLKHFCRKYSHLFFEGLEAESTKVQISVLLNEFGKQTKDPFTKKLNLTQWTEVFDYLTGYIKKHPKKLVIVFDEFQWLACQQSHLVHLIKLYWDNYWKSLNVMLILCGSVAHFMVDKVIKSKALYGRVNLELPMRGLSPCDARKMLSHRGDFEALKYLLIFGTVPKYLEEVEQNKSFDENINRLCFKRHGYFLDEVDKIFFSQFREVQIYKKIITALSKRNLSLAEISKTLDIPSGGGLRSYLTNLEAAGFVRSYTSLYQKGRRNQKFKLFDEYLNFYFKFMQVHIKQIAENERQQIFKNQVEQKWKPWLGIAFEVFCLKNALYIAEKAGFAEEVISFSPLFGGTDEKFQIDLIFVRTHSIVTVCEIKFHEKQISTDVIPEVERKISILPRKRGQTVEKMLIAPFGSDESLTKSQYFHHVISMEDLLY